MQRFTIGTRHRVVGLDRAQRPEHEALRSARDFERKAARKFELRRDPEPFEVNGRVLLPTFELVASSDPERRVALEILGYFTRDSLEEKLASISGLRYLLCVDEAKACGPGELPAHPSVVAFRRRLDPELVLRALSAVAGARSD